MPRSRAALAVPLLALALAGCVPTPVAGPTLEPSPSETTTSSPSATPTATPSAGPETVSVTATCHDLISAQALYDYNPNVSLLAAFDPDRSSLAGEAVAQQGIACRYINQSSGQTIDVGVVKFTDSGLDAKMASVGTSATSSDVFNGYFDVIDGAGVAQAFAGPYWVTVASVTFIEAGDAGPLISTVVGSLS